ncbi:MAG: acyl-CoA dehydrogenase family protein, partial [Candidatus Binatia bacterium]
MFDFSPEQKMVRDMVRQWAERELAPVVPELERAERPPYDVMRKMVAAFGLPDMARARFASMARRRDKGEAERQEGDATMGDPAFGMILAVELARHSPGYLMSFGASMGLAGGAIMARGTLEQKLRFAQPLFTME